MLVRFDSDVGGFTMFGDIAVQLLKMMGHSGTVPSAIVAKDIPPALKRLQAALGALPPEPAQAPKARDDLEYVDQEVVVDTNLITSRSPEDLPAFSEAIVSQLAGTTTKEEEKS